MRLSSRTHGIIDLVIGLALLITPFALGFGLVDAAGWVAVAAGIAVLLNMLLTDFEFGRMRSVQLTVHLWIDGLIGLFLAASPWLLTFDQTAWVPHVAAGVLLIIVAFLTQTIPGYDRRAGASVPG